MTKVLPLFLLAACQDYTLEEVKPESIEFTDLVVSPNPLVFASAPVGESAVKALTITNKSAVTISIDSVTIESGAQFEIIRTDTNVTEGRLAQDESMDVAITWTSSGGDDLGQAIVVSENIEEEVVVDLVGGALIPALTIDPDAVDFGSVGIDATAEETILLINTGDAPLTITEISETESVFGHSGQGLPLELQPGEESELTVTFTPGAAEIYSGRLEVVSDDPDGTKFATLNGEGSEKPIAVCEADPAEILAISEDMTWVGDGSYDPGGLDITDYQWTLVSSPAGSRVTMPTGDANRSRFTPDLVGEYVAELVVTNSAGQVSDPAECTLTALPGGDLWVEMFWTHSGDDMDLHLLAPGGRFEDRSTDCFYSNCTGSGLDWGVRGDTDDNPSLDLDDVPGTGPENINIADPEAGTFTVIVHDFGGGSIYNGSNDVTVNVYLGGALEWSGTEDVNFGEDVETEFCTIEMPAGRVTSLL